MKGELSKNRHGGDVVAEGYTSLPWLRRLMMLLLVLVLTSGASVVAAVPSVSFDAPQIYPGPGKLIIRVREKPNILAIARVEIAPHGTDQTVLNVPVKSVNAESTEAIVNIAGLVPGPYDVTVALLDLNTKKIKKFAAGGFDWPGRPKWLIAEPPIKIRNNLVMDLLDETEAKPGQTYPTLLRASAK